MFKCIGFGNCQMIFTRSEHLIRHIRKHTGERPFTCHCGRSFSRVDNVRQHCVAVHRQQYQQNTATMATLIALHNTIRANTSNSYRQSISARRARRNASSKIESDTPSVFDSSSSEGETYGDESTTDYDNNAVLHGLVTREIQPVDFPQKSHQFSDSRSSSLQSPQSDPIPTSSRLHDHSFSHSEDGVLAPSFQFESPRIHNHQHSHYQRQQEHSQQQQQAQDYYQQHYQHHKLLQQQKSQEQRQRQRQALRPQPLMDCYQLQERLSQQQQRQQQQGRPQDVHIYDSNQIENPSLSINLPGSYYNEEVGVDTSTLPSFSKIHSSAPLLSNLRASPLHFTLESSTYLSDQSDYSNQTSPSTLSVALSDPRSSITSLDSPSIGSCEFNPISYIEAFLGRNSSQNNVSSSDAANNLTSANAGSSLTHPVLANEGFDYYSSSGGRSCVNNFEVPSGNHSDTTFATNIKQEQVHYDLPSESDPLLSHATLYAGSPPYRQRQLHQHQQYRQDHHSRLMNGQWSPPSFTNSRAYDGAPN